MKKPIVLLCAFCAGALLAQEVAVKPILPVPRPPIPVFRPENFRQNEQPVTVETKSEVVADNGLYRRVETTITFTNPNGRVFAGELEFPLPDGATVCGYALEVNGVMTPGVICEKEKARAAFENEMRKGVDPGLVEHVKGNLWKTRIYPLNPNEPRKAIVAYLEPLAGEPLVVAERDGDDVFVADRGTRMVKRATVASRLRAADKAWILWDASYSRQGKTAADRNLLETLPEKGEWTLVVFRDVPEKPQTFTDRAELLKAVDAAPCDGGTSFAKLVAALPENRITTFLFSDEADTLSVKAPDLETLGVVFASRPDTAPRTIFVRKALAGEKLSVPVKEGKLLATAWAANRIADLAAQADARQDEFLALGRKYGVASPVTSLIVFERLDQYLEHKIEPPATSSFHDAWVKRRAAEDDAIAAKSAKTEHERELLRYWEERVKWWNDPIPKKETPKSGLFDGVAHAEDRSASASASLGVRRSKSVVALRSFALAAAADVDNESDGFSGAAVEVACCAAEADFSDNAERKANRAEAAGATVNATVKIAAWDPKMPYLDALGKVAVGEAYATYLKEREVYGKAPSFYLDCAGWFFKAKEPMLACRILSTLAELKLEDAGLWRTMGWRLREAGAYDAAVDVFRHVLAMRGEEAQSKRDLALVLTERGKANRSAADLNEAARLLKTAAFEPSGRRVGTWFRRGNDFQTSVLALEELNGLLAWCAANKAKVADFVAPEIDAAYRRDLPLDLRIVLSWDTDETDVDLHVLEPNGEEAYYQHRRTSTGGFVSEDVTTGYGPEEYLKKAAEKGVYKILAHYFASHRQALTGAATVTATVYKGWGTAGEERQVLSFRLDKPKDKHPIGEIAVQ